MYKGTNLCEWLGQIIMSILQRVRLLAADKGIKTEEINIHLKVKPDWYLEKVNPVGKVPTIEHNGHYIPESLIAFGKWRHYMSVRSSYFIVHFLV